jgi:hypothetical protein
MVPTNVGAKRIAAQDEIFLKLSIWGRPGAMRLQSPLTCADGSFRIFQWLEPGEATLMELGPRAVCRCPASTRPNSRTSP